MQQSDLHLQRRLDDFNCPANCNKLWRGQPNHRILTIFMRKCNKMPPATFLGWFEVCLLAVRATRTTRATRIFSAAPSILTQNVPSSLFSCCTRSTGLRCFHRSFIPCNVPDQQDPHCRLLFAASERTTASCDSQSEP